MKVLLELSDKISTQNIFRITVSKFLLLIFGGLISGRKEKVVSGNQVIASPKLQLSTGKEFLDAWTQDLASPSSYLKRQPCLHFPVGMKPERTGRNIRPGRDLELRPDVRGSKASRLLLGKTEPCCLRVWSHKPLVFSPLKNNNQLEQTYPLWSLMLIVGCVGARINIVSILFCYESKAALEK